MNQNALAQRAFFLKQFDASISHELVARALDRLADLRDAGFYFQKGEEHRLKNELSLAISYYERALKIDERHKEALFYLGWAYLGGSDEATGEDIIDDVQIAEDERTKRAVFAYRRLIDIMNDESLRTFFTCIAYHNYSIALYRLGKYNDALDCSYQALKVKENYGSAYLRLAFTKLAMGLCTEALRDCERAIDLGENDANSYNARGLIQLTMGNYEDAMSSFYDSIGSNPMYIYPYLHLNGEYRRQRKYSKALRILDRAMERNPKYADFYYYHALTDDEMDNGDKAVINYKKFLELVPSRSTRFTEHIKHAHKRLRELQKSIR